MLIINCLGQLDIRVDGVPVEIATRKAKALLVYVACQAGQVFTRGHLAALLWGERETELAARSLRQALVNLKKVLPAGDLSITRDAISFNRDSVWQSDVKRLEIENEVGVYQGAFLQGFDLPDAPLWEEWLLAKREQLQVKALAVFESAGAQLAAQGAYSLAIAKYQNALMIDPWRETAHQALMRLFVVNGDRSAALAQYEKCRAALQKGLGIAPLPETLHLYQRILNGDLSRLRGELMSPSLPFVGRADHHARIIAAWQKRKSVGATLLLVEGEAGLGKTRLVEESLRLLAARQVIILRGQCVEFSAERPYRPIIESLRQLLALQISIEEESRARWKNDLARLLPELGASESPPMWDEAARRQLFNSVAQCLITHAAVSPLILFIDDLHWADAASLDLFFHVLNAAADSRADIFFVGAYRAEDLSPHLRQPLNELKSDARAQILQLAPLDDAAVHHLAAAFGKTPRLIELLQRESGGNPFVVSELIRDLQERGVLRENGGRWILNEAEMDVTARGDELILQRVRRLSKDGARYLNVAALIGQPFTADFLAATVGERAENLQPIFESLRERYLMRVDSDRRFVFAHDRIQEALQRHLPVDVCKLWHERIGQTLIDWEAETLSPDDLSSQIAYHLERSYNPRRAAPYLQRAAEAAQQVFAHLMAINCYRRLLPLGKPDDHAAIWLRVAQLQLECGQWVEAEESFRHAVEYARDSLWKSRAWIALSDFMLSRARYVAAQESAQHAEELAREVGAQTELLEALLKRGWALCRLGRNRAALQLAEEARLLAQTTERELWCLHLLARVEAQLGQFSHALLYNQRSLDRARAIKDENAEAVTLNALGEAHRLSGDFESAMRCYREALAIVNRRKHRPSAIAYMSNLGGALSGAGRYADAEKILRDVLALPQSAGWGGLSETYSFLAQASLGQHQLPDALDNAARSLTLARQSDQCDTLTMAWRVLGQVKRELETGSGKWEVGSRDLTPDLQPLTAKDCFIESLRLCDQAEMLGERAWTLRAMGLGAVGGDTVEARHLQARQLFDQLQMMW